MARFLKQSTASQEAVIGPFVDDTDAITLETGLSIANTDIKLVKGGTTVQVNKDSGGATHLANGMFHLTFNASDTSALGILDVSVKKSGALLVREVFYVLDAEAFDALHGTGNGVRADVQGWLGATPATPSVSGVPEVDVTHVSGGLEDISTATALSTIDGNVDAILVDTGTTLDGKLNTIDTNVDAILVDTAEIGTAGAGLTAIPTQDANVVQISGDTTAANNLEAAFDGTGYDDGGVNRIGANLKEVDQVAIVSHASGRVPSDVRAINSDISGSAGDLQDFVQNGYDSANNRVFADVTAISGSTDAADNLEAWWANVDAQVNVASATATTVVFDDAAMIGTDDYYNGMIVFVYGGTGAGQARLVTSYVGSTKTATVFPAWGTNPDATSDVIVTAGPGIGADMAETDVEMYGTTRNLPEVLNFLAAMMRNEVNVDSDSIDLRNDADSGNLATWGISDDGTTFVVNEGT